jgi:hypothetical protein
MDPVANRIKCGPHGCKKKQDKVMDLSHKTMAGVSAGGDGIRTHREALMSGDTQKDCGLAFGGCGLR